MGTAFGSSSARFSRGRSVAAAIAVLAVAIAGLALPVDAASAAGGPTVVVGAPDGPGTTGGVVTGTNAVHVPVTLSGFTPTDSLTVSLSLPTGGGALSFLSSPRGASVQLNTGYTSFTGVSAVAFTGTASDVAPMLQDALQWRAPSSGDPVQLSVSAVAVPTGYVYNPANGHFYQNVALANSLTWTSAKALAAGATFAGQTGYLATLTSKSEGAFVKNNVSSRNVWIGGSDDSSQGASEGNWKWVTGPEAGTPIWTGTAGGSPVGGSYTQWNVNEPNNNGSGGENFMGLNPLIDANSAAKGRWNDYVANNGDVKGYLVEYGGVPGQASTAVSASTLGVLQATPPIAVGSRSSGAFVEGAVAAAPGSAAVPFSVELQRLASATSGSDLVATVQVPSGGGTVALANPSRFTQPIGYTLSGATANLGFQGSAAAVASALRNDLTWQAPSGAATTKSFIISVAEKTTNAFFNPANGHYYLAIPSPNAVSFGSARTTASSQRLFGMTGYLATVTSGIENDFTKTYMAAPNAWLGASSAYDWTNPVADIQYADLNASKGKWYWIDGPEAGLQFWNGVNPGSAVPGGYANWFTGEPNDANGTERFMGTNVSGTAGFWNDFDFGNGSVKTTIVEFGGMPNEVSTAASSSRTASFTTQTVPATPAAPSAVLSSSAPRATATVSWIAPADGNSPITGYTVTASPGGATCTTTAPTCDVTGLTPGATYAFTVVAMNAIGASATSPASAALVMADAAPDAPASATATQTGSTVVVDWTAPPVTAVSAILDYRVTLSPGTGSCTVSATSRSCTITGQPVSGGPYTASVVARNAAGASPARVSNGTPAMPAAPAAPTAVRSASTPRTAATVSWLAPSDGNSAITGYTVTATPGGATCTTSALTCDVTGLTPGASYAFRVVATNAVGTGSSSPASTTLTMSDAVPGAPTSLAATQSGSSLVLTWSAPADTSVSPLIDYTATVSPGSGTCTVSASSTTCTVTGAPLAGGPYTVSLVARNSAGSSTAATAVATPSVPSAPGAPTVVADAGTATISWTAPSVLAGTTSYTVTAAPGGETCQVAAPATSCVITGLVASSPYSATRTFTVVATGPQGDSAASSASSPSSFQARVSSPPRSVRAVQTGTTAVVSWAAPTDSGGTPVTSYTVTDAASGLTCTATAPAVSCTVTGLTDRAYDFAVVATNGVGASSRSASQPFTAGLVGFTDPAQEAEKSLRTLLSISLRDPGWDSSSVVAVTIGLPAGGSLVADAASGSLTNHPSVRISGGATSLTLSGPVADLTAALRDSVSVDASATTGDYPVRFDVGETAPGSVSGSTTGTLAVVPVRTAPGAPTGVTATASGTTVTVSWTSPAVTGGRPVTGYTVTSTPGGATCSPTGSATSCQVTGLTPGTTYTFGVTAANAIGTGAAGTSSPVRIAPVVPGAPTSIAVVQDSDTSAVISWAAPADGGSAITGYTVTDSASGKSCTATAPATSCRITGLVAGTAYDFQVTATNAVGTGASSSDPSGSTTVDAVVIVARPFTVVQNQQKVLALDLVDAGWPVGRTATVKVSLAAGGSLSVIDANADGLVDGHPSVAITSNAPSLITLVGSPADVDLALRDSVLITAGATTGAFALRFDTSTSGSGGVRASEVDSFAVVPPPTQPAAPTAVVATAASRSAVVSWRAPSSDGGSAILGSTVTAYPGGQQCTTTGSADSCTVTGLTSGASYSFGVVARNTAGTSASSGFSAAVTVPAEVPAAPSGVSVAQISATSVRVTWVGSTDDGGAAIQSYTVSVPSTSRTCTAAATDRSCDITGLTAGATYSFRVVATNSVGASPAAVSTGSTTLGVTTVSPTAPGIEAGEESSFPIVLDTTKFTGSSDVTVRLLLPAGAGTFSISAAYLAAHPGLTVTGDGTGDFTITGPAADVAAALRDALITGGRIAGTHDLTIETSQAAPSTVKNVTTTSISVTSTVITEPAAPSAVSATAQVRAVQVSWNAPGDGGSAITRYVVTAAPGGATCSPTTDTGRSCIVTGLTAGTAYGFTVTAENAIGRGAASASASATALATVPGPVTGVAVVQNGTSGTISWTAPTDDGGSPITRYTVTDAASGLSCTVLAPATSCTVSPLIDGQVYDFVVVAENAIGGGTTSPGRPTTPGLVTPGGTTTTIGAGGTNALPVAIDTTRLTPGGTTTVVLSLLPGAGTLAVIDADGDGFVDAYPSVRISGNGTNVLTLTGPTADVAAAARNSVRMTAGPNPGSTALTIDIAQTAPTVIRGTTVVPLVISVPVPVAPGGSVFVPGGSTSGSPALVTAPSRPRTPVFTGGAGDDSAGASELTTPTATPTPAPSPTPSARPSGATAGSGTDSPDGSGSDSGQGEDVDGAASDDGFGGSLVAALGAPIVIIGLGLLIALLLAAGVWYAGARRRRSEEE